MLIQKSTRGFTLIELLVVITIIGILATGATATYTSQIQKARDTTRVNDVKALQSGIEQYYQDKSEYPDATLFASGVITYTTKIPADPKNGQTCASGDASVPMCAYAYKVSQDDNNIANGAYEISTAFENKGNVDSKSKTDDNGGGNKDDNRLEMGVRTTAGIDTKITITASKATDLSKANCTTGTRTSDANGTISNVAAGTDLIVTCTK